MILDLLTSSDPAASAVLLDLLREQYPALTRLHELSPREECEGDGDGAGAGYGFGYSDGEGDNLYGCLSAGSFDGEGDGRGSGSAGGYHAANGYGDGEGGLRRGGPTWSGEYRGMHG